MSFYFFFDPTADLFYSTGYLSDAFYSSFHLTGGSFLTSQIYSGSAHLFSDSDYYTVDYSPYFY